MTDASAHVSLAPNTCDMTTDFKAAVTATVISAECAHACMHLDIAATSITLPLNCKLKA
jgi:hypothetical protein